MGFMDIAFTPINIIKEKMFSIIFTLNIITDYIFKNKQQIV